MTPIEKDIDRLVKKGSISEKDRECYVFLLYLMKYGAKKFRKDKSSNVKFWMANLYKSGYIKKTNDKIYMDKDYLTNPISIHLMALCAMGLIERK